MNKLIVIVTSTLFIFITSSCGKHTRNTTPAAPIYFNGVSFTGLDGTPMSVPDSTDWKTNDNWTSQEAGLFATTYSTTCSAGFNYTILAYPNSCNGIFQLSLSHPTNARLAYRLVDENFNVLLSGDTLTTSNVQLNAATFSIHDTVRLYYKFIDGSCEFRGHGDIIIQ